MVLRRAVEKGIKRPRRHRHASAFWRHGRPAGRRWARSSTPSPSGAGLFGADCRHAFFFWGVAAGLREGKPQQLHWPKRPKIAASSRPILCLPRKLAHQTKYDGLDIKLLFIVFFSYHHFKVFSRQCDDVEVKILRATSSKNIFGVYLLLWQSLWQCHRHSYLDWHLKNYASEVSWWWHSSHILWHSSLLSPRTIGIY